MIVIKYALCLHEINQPTAHNLPWRHSPWSKCKSTTRPTTSGSSSTTRVSHFTLLPRRIWKLTVSVVYNVTNYLEDHPGGKEVLIEAAGTDATEAFEEIGHSDEAREQLEPYFVGDLPSEVLS